MSTQVPPTCAAAMSRRTTNRLLRQNVDQCSPMLTLHHSDCGLMIPAKADGKGDRKRTAVNNFACRLVSILMPFYHLLTRLIIRVQQRVDRRSKPRISL